MSNKTTAEIEHKLTVDNAEAVKKVEAQAAAYKKLADAQKQAEARERTGTTGMDADTVRLLRMARADKAAGRYTDMASQGFSNEDMMKRYRAERNLVMPDAQKREMERTQAMLAGGGAGGKSGGALSAILKGGAIGAGIGAAADAGASVIKDYYEGQKSFGQALKDATRETVEGLPIIGGFVKSVRQFGEQLLYGGQMAGTAMTLGMIERGGNIRRGRYEIDDARMGLQGDAAAARARADAAQEASIMAYVNRNELDPKDPRIVSAQNSLEGSRIGLAGATASRDAAGRNMGVYDKELSVLRAQQNDVTMQRRGVADFKERSNGLLDVSDMEAILAKKALEIEKEIEDVSKRRAAGLAQYGAAQKAVAEATLKAETDALEVGKQRLQVAKDAVQQYKDKALTFDQMDPEQQFQLSMDFEQAKAGGVGSMAAEQKRRLLGSGLAGKDLIEQFQNAATNNPLLQGILAGQGGKTLDQLREEQTQREQDLKQLAPKGPDSKTFELQAEYQRAIAQANLDSIPQVTAAIAERINAGFAVIAEAIRSQDLKKQALGY